jgi:hypothetical protein
MRLLSVCLLMLLMNSCTRYYLCITDEPVVVFSDPALLKYNYVLEQKNQLIVKEKPGQYYYIRTASGSGYIKKRRFKTRVRYSRSEAVAFTFTAPTPPNLSTNSPNVKPSQPASNSSRSSAAPTYSPARTVNVRGYYRKDGTYVRPHTRSAPRRR